MAGSIQTFASVSYPGKGVVQYQFDWTATAGGAVSAIPKPVKAGSIFQAKFVPLTGPPTALYDVELQDNNGVDFLAASGANLSDTLAKVATINAGLGLFFPGGDLTLVVANAGNATTGRVIVWLKERP